MGIDKEAMDIWMFGRPRPDLSAQETFALMEKNDSNKPADPATFYEYMDRRMDGLLAKIPEMRERIEKMIADRNNDALAPDR